MTATVVLAAAVVVGTIAVGARTAPFTVPARRPRPTAPTDGWAAGRSGAVGRRHRRSPASPRHRRASNRPAHTAAEWATLLDAVSTHLRSGSSLLDAWSSAIDERRVCGDAVQSDRTLAATVATPTSDADEAVVLQAMGAAMMLGGPMAATVDAAAAMLREREAIRAEAAAHSAQARLSARVLTAVPLLFAAWSTASSSSFRHSITTPLGATFVVVGGLLNLGGWRWMQRIVTRATR